MTPAQRVGAGASLAAVVALATPLVAKWEGLSLRPYPDMAQKLTTWCYGETAGVPKSSYTKAECDALLRESLTKHARPILKCLPADAPLEVKVAFVSLGYNVGVTAACNSSAARRARAGDYVGACNGLLAWNKARVNGKLVEVKGLTNRRKDEHRLCLSGL